MMRRVRSADLPPAKLTDVLRPLRSFRDEGPDLDPWTLRFHDAWLERRFQDSYYDTNLQYIRIATVLGAIVWAGCCTARWSKTRGRTWDTPGTC